MTGDDVLAAAERCRVALEPALGSDWTVPVPGLKFTVTGVLGHAALAPMWYSADLWGGPEDNAAFEVAVAADAPNEKLLTSVLVAARVLAATVDAAPPETRGFHPYGSPDPSGFAAMACDELLVHGDDAARALGITFTPEPGLADAVLARLYPWHVVDDDPWRVLLWANGRIERPGLPFQQRWVWHPEPLSEWDGVARTPAPRGGPS
jgi:hypothetical protein